VRGPWSAAVPVELEAAGALTTGVAVTVAVGVNVTVAVGVSVGVAVTPAAAVTLAAAVTVGVNVAVAVNVVVGVTDAVAVSVAVGVSVALAVGVGAGGGNIAPARIVPLLPASRQRPTQLTPPNPLSVLTACDCQVAPPLLVTTMLPGALLAAMQVLASEQPMATRSAENPEACGDQVAPPSVLFKMGAAAEGASADPTA